MKILVTKEQLDIIRENDSKKFNCDKCEHSWKIRPEDKFPYLCNMCGYDSHKKKYNYEELENFWKNYKKEEEEITEKWTEKYKKSINCSNPKGFSQRAHCQGRKKHLKESKEEEIEKNGFDIEGIKVALNAMSKLSNTYGDQVPIKFTLETYDLKKTTMFTSRSKPILQLYINVKTENGELYEMTQRNRHEISVELLGILEMFGLYKDEYMSPYYNFHFNKKYSEDLI